MTAIDFIKKKPYLFWYVENPEELSKEAIVEGVLNYGDFNDVQKIIAILGVKRVASIFRRQINRKRKNYEPAIINYFKLYFGKYA